MNSLVGCGMGTLDYVVSSVEWPQNGDAGSRREIPCIEQLVFTLPVVKPPTTKNWLAADYVSTFLFMLEIGLFALYTSHGGTLS